MGSKEFDVCFVESLFSSIWTSHFFLYLQYPFFPSLLHVGKITVVCTPLSIALVMLYQQQHWVILEYSWLLSWKIFSTLEAGTLYDDVLEAYFIHHSLCILILICMYIYCTNSGLLWNGPDKNFKLRLREWGDGMVYDQLSFRDENEATKPICCRQRCIGTRS